MEKLARLSADAQLSSEDAAHGIELHHFSHLIIVAKDTRVEVFMVPQPNLSKIKFKLTFMSTEEIGWNDIRTWEFAKNKNNDIVIWQYSCVPLSLYLSLCLSLSQRKSHVLVSLHMLVISVCGFRSRLVTPLEFLMKEPAWFWFASRHNMKVFVHMLILSASMLVQNTLAPAHQSFSSFFEDAHVWKVSVGRELASLSVDAELSI